MATPRVFISYRRTDAPGHAGRLYDWMEDAFGAENVFFDIHGMTGGDTFKKKIKTELEERTTTLAIVIGPNWDLKRLSQENDYVRYEIKTALSKKLAPVK